MAGEKIRVVICDDHELFRRGVAEMLDVAGDLEVVGEASDHDEAVAVVGEQRPDVVLLDLEMPGVGADEAVERILELSPPPGVVIFTMRDEPKMVQRFLGRGGAAYFPKSVEMDEREVRGLVEDDGAGFDPRTVDQATLTWGAGLRSMRERAEILGGGLEIDSEPRRGTRVEIRAPLDERWNGVS